jgi:hypothetical protein
LRVSSFGKGGYSPERCNVYRVVAWEYIEETFTLLFFMILYLQGCCMLGHLHRALYEAKAVANVSSPHFLARYAMEEELEWKHKLSLF